MTARSKFKAWWTMVRSLRLGRILDGCTKIFNFSWKTALILLGISLLCYIFSEVGWKLSRRYREAYYMTSFFGNGIMVKAFADGTCYTYDCINDKRLSPRLDWVSDRPENDSLTVFCDTDGKRGFLNVNTGKIEIEGQYLRAWHFSEGLAAVQGDNGMIGFVNYDNEVVIPMTFRYVRGFDYVFKNGYCVITDPDTGLYGVIDREGEWKYSPDYDSFMQIYSGADYWLVRKDGLEGLLDSEMNVVFETVYDEIDYASQYGTAFLTKDGMKQLVSFEGEVLEPFVINELCVLSYPVEIDELDDAGYEIHPYIAKYSIGDDRWGVMNSQTGVVIIPAIYSDIHMASSHILMAYLRCGDEAVVYDIDGNKLKNP